MLSVSAVALIRQFVNKEEEKEGPENGERERESEDHQSCLKDSDTSERTKTSLEMTF